MSTQKEKEESSKAETTEQQPRAPQSGELREEHLTRSPAESVAVRTRPGLAAEPSLPLAWLQT